MPPGPSTNISKPAYGTPAMTDKPDFQQLAYNEIIAFCLKFEQEAVALYRRLAEMTPDEAAKSRYKALAEMEQEHVRRLENLDEEAFLGAPPIKIIDLKITDYLTPIEPDENLTTQEVLIMAAQREKTARELYLTLARKYAGEPFLAEFFTMMADEEAQHKHALETEYERHILGEF